MFRLFGNPCRLLSATISAFLLSSGHQNHVFSPLNRSPKAFCIILTGFEPYFCPSFSIFGVFSERIGNALGMFWERFGNASERSRVLSEILPAPLSSPQASICPPAGREARETPLQPYFWRKNKPFGELLPRVLHPAHPLPASPTFTLPPLASTLFRIIPNNHLFLLSRIRNNRAFLLTY